MPERELETRAQSFFGDDMNRLHPVMVSVGD